MNLDYVFLSPDHYLDASPERIDKEHFVKTYSEIYNHRFAGGNLEKRIEALLADQRELSTEDLKDILCWKTGRLCVNKTILFVGNGISIDKVEEYLLERRQGVFKGPFPEDEKVFNDHEWETCTKFLNELTNVHGIGLTYALSFLYFISNGQYPIYDRFARMAVYAISDTNRTDFEKKVPEGTLNTNKEEAFKEYKQYCEDLHNIFEDRYVERDVDKALWVYGHLFKSK